MTIRTGVSRIVTCVRTDDETLTGALGMQIRLKTNGITPEMSTAIFAHRFTQPCPPYVLGRMPINCSNILLWNGMMSHTFPTYTSRCRIVTYRAENAPRLGVSNILLLRL